MLIGWRSKQGFKKILLLKDSFWNVTKVNYSSILAVDLLYLIIYKASNGVLLYTCKVSDKGNKLQQKMS